MSAPHGMGPPKPRKTKAMTVHEKQTCQDIAEIFAGAGDAVVHILPNGEVKILDTDPAVDKAFNAGIQAAIRWHKGRARALSKITARKTDVILHQASAVLLKALKR